MPRNKPIDTLWILWSICLVKHYQERGIPTSPKQISNEFGSDMYQLFRIACELAAYYKLIDDETMQLTPKGLVACANWKQISNKVYSV